MRHLIILIILASVAAAEEGAESVLNSRPSYWNVSDWMNSPPIGLEEMHGRVVLVRWWTGPYCPYCKASSEALETWHEQYSDQGLLVVGLYHHKSGTELDTADVRLLANSLGFSFPVAIDREWRTLREWWLEPVAEAHFTSVTFLLDRDGMVRFVHPGGQYVRGDGAYESMEGKIQELLREKAATP